MTMTRESVTTTIQKRSGSLLDLDESGTWGFQMALCSQILEKLPEGFDQTSLESPGLGRSQDATE